MHTTLLQSHKGLEVKRLCLLKHLILLSGFIQNFDYLCILFLACTNIFQNFTTSEQTKSRALPRISGAPVGGCGPQFKNCCSDDPQSSDHRSSVRHFWCAECVCSDRFMLGTGQDVNIKSFNKHSHSIPIRVMPRKKNPKKQEVLPKETGNDKIQTNTILNFLDVAVSI